MHMHVGMASGSTASGLVAVPAASTTAPACPASTTRFVRSTGRRRCRRRRALSCRASGDEGLLWLPRRDVLAGLTGMAAAGALAADPASAALPAESEGCRRGDKVTAALIDCLDRGLPCPPSPDGVKLVDFDAAAEATKTMRVRRPVHLLSSEEAAKYREAVGKMKALEPDNPVSFTQQAAIHEAYCDGHYRYDPTEKNRPFDVHFSWIFAPWHRMYIYFYERALGDLIGDDTFALPYWNWDAPEGMVVPPLFRDSFANPLYDKNRNTNNLDKVMHLDFGRAPLVPFLNPPPAMAADHKKLVDKNLSTLYQQMIRGGKGARCFLGEKLCSEASFRVKEINERSKRRRGQGELVKLKRGNTQGSLERMAHSAVHVWVGRQEEDKEKCKADVNGVMGHDGAKHCGNDMGFLGSAARDPIFYSHHSNVDRMWHLWSTKLGGGRGFDDPEWRDASFVFYAGPKKLVRIKVSDVLDTANLGYTYDDDASPAADLPWINSKPTPLVPHGPAAPAAGATPKPKPPPFPVTLASNAIVEVPSVARPKKENGKVQVLVVDGIEYDPTVGNTFVVAINVPEGKAREVGPQHSEYAGVFSVVPSSKDQEDAKAKNITGRVTLGAKLSLVLDDVLAEIGADGDDAVDVVFVGGENSGEVTINFAPRIQNEAC